MSPFLSIASPTELLRLAKRHNLLALTLISQKTSLGQQTPLFLVVNEFLEESSYRWSQNTKLIVGDIDPCLAHTDVDSASNLPEKNELSKDVNTWNKRSQSRSIRDRPEKAGRETSEVSNYVTARFTERCTESRRWEGRLAWRRLSTFVVEQDWRMTPERR